MRTYFICIVGILCLSIIPCKAQKITVHLSVEWTKRFDKESEKWLSKYKIDSIPLLTISYQNNSNCDLYMLKAVQSENYIAYIGVRWIVGEMLSPMYIDSQDPSFNCIFRKQSGEDWKLAGILSNNDKYHKTNAKFESLFNKIMKFEIWDNNNSYLFFPNDLLHSSIFKNKKNDFIFLKKHETLKNYYNLLGFYLIGGDYKFYLRNNKFNYSIFTQPQSIEKEFGKTMFDGTTVLLPQYIDTYTLYSNMCKSDTVHVNFYSPTKR